ncbi:hypothetical protein PF010_g13259, partial [Phytophthora fragariae]
MAQRRVDTQKKAKCQKEEVKLPVLSPPSPSKVKDIPMPSKPAPTPNGAKIAKAPPPKSPSKPTARSTPTKLTAPVKTQPAQSSTSQTAVNKTPEESSGPDASAVPATDTSNATLVVKSSQLEAEGSSISTEEPPPEHVDVDTDVISAAEVAAAAEEAERLRQLNGTGMVKLIYESYDELFPIEGGSTTQANIDEVYCLSFVMPNCLVRISKHPNPERFQREEAGVFDSLVREDPRGTYHDLVKDETYYVVVEQEADQLRRDQEATRALWGGELQKQKADKDDDRGFESCSCIYGNPYEEQVEGILKRRKHRLHQSTPREWQQARFFEMELPLHAVVTALDHDDDTMDESFELLGGFYALYPDSTALLDHQRRPPLYYALEQRWGLEKLSWLVDKSLGVVLEKDSDGLALVAHAIVNKCPEELVIRLAVAAAARCIIAVEELLDGQHFKSARRFCHRALVDFFPGVPKFP